MDEKQNTISADMKLNEVYNFWMDDNKTQQTGLWIQFKTAVDVIVASFAAILSV